MKQKRLVLVLLFALGSGVLAGFLALQYLRNQARPLAAAEAPKGKVVVAAMDLPLGTVLTAQQVRVIDWPGAVPAGFATSPTEVIGRGLITGVYTDEPLLASKLADKESGGGLSIIIPEGMRALSVRVDEVIGVAGFVLPGTRVDVLLTIKPQNDSQETQPATRVILQNMLTLAAGQTIQRDAEGKPQTVAVITLLVTPEQSERLTLAANEGRIHLALRNTLDMAEVATPGVRANALIATSQAPRAAARPVRVRPVTSGVTTSPASTTTVVEMYRGGERTLSTFNEQR
jgi:pilus assembly protein CpaB